MPKKQKKKIKSWRYRRISAVVIAFLVAGAFSTYQTKALKDRLTSRPSVTLAQVTQDTSCTLQRNLPDEDCTPGAVWPSATRTQICISGYSSLVRKVNSQEKEETYDRYDIPKSKRNEFEVDHLVSLQLGGSNDFANLWPLQTEIKDRKDRVENHLKRKVCAGKMPLQLAQQEIAEDWTQIYEAEFGKE